MACWEGLRVCSNPLKGPEKGEPRCVLSETLYLYYSIKLLVWLPMA